MKRASWMSNLRPVHTAPEKFESVKASNVYRPGLLEDGHFGFGIE